MSNNNDYFRDQEKMLLEMTLPPSENHNEIPEWKKHLWMQLIRRNTESSWPYEGIIKDYNELRSKYYSLYDQTKKIKEIGEKYHEIDKIISSLENENKNLKQEMKSLKIETEMKLSSYEKIKKENNHLVSAILKAKQTEVELQNKIFELESKK